MLDIDIAERLRCDNVLDSNLVIVGSADVNVLCKLLLDRTNSYDVWQVGFAKPYDIPAIRDSHGKLHMFTTSPRTGLLALYDNPWTGLRRIALLSAGFFAVGLVAANRLLLDYVRRQRSGNNSLVPAVPMRLVDGIVTRYPHVELKAIDDCVPPMDVVNISTIEVLE